MNTTNKLLDKAREVCSSDNAIAGKLKVSRSAVSKWRHGGKIEPAQLAKLIDLAQADPAVAVQVMAEQEATPEERRMWGVVWDRLSPVTTVIGVALLALPMLSGWQVGAMPIMSNWRGLKRLGQWCRRKAGHESSTRDEVGWHAGIVRA